MREFSMGILTIGRSYQKKCLRNFRWLSELRIFTFRKIPHSLLSWTFVRIRIKVRTQFFCFKLYVTLERFRGCDFPDSYTPIVNTKGGSLFLKSRTPFFSVIPLHDFFRQFLLRSNVFLGNCPPASLTKYDPSLIRETRLHYISLHFPCSHWYHTDRLSCLMPSLKLRGSKLWPDEINTAKIEAAKVHKKKYSYFKTLSGAHYWRCPEQETTAAWTFSNALGCRMISHLWKN